MNPTLKTIQEGMKEISEKYSKDYEIEASPENYIHEGLNSSQFLSHLQEDTTSLIKQILQAEVERLRGEIREVVLEKPQLRQYEEYRTSAPFFCTLCGMDEIKISDNKLEDGNYACSCSVWTDPHNAYMDKSGGKWVKWYDKEKALTILKELPIEDTGYNQSKQEDIDHLEDIIKEL